MVRQPQSHKLGLSKSMKTSSYIMFFVFHLLASISYQLANLPNLSYVALFSLVTCVSSRTLLIGAHLVWVKSARAFTCQKIAILFLPLFQLLFLLIKLSHIWHLRLGHPSNAKLNLLKYNNVQICDLNEDFFCDVCPLAKQKRLPFNESLHIFENYFDLIHCDLWGPFSVSTIDSCKYFLTIVDDCSRCTWVYLLKHKSQTQSILEQFCTMVETKFSRKVKVIRIDNGTEFIMSDFFAKKGILHHLSCVETPQQNA